MFGYVLPTFGDLKVKEYSRFKACYCGMCHELKRSYGQASRFILNYDFVFLAMLLDRRTSAPDYEMKACAVSPFCKKCVCAKSPVLRYCSACSVILTYWKLCDAVNDEGFLKSTVSRVLRGFLRSAYGKAKSECSGFDSIARQLLTELSILEKQNEKSLDRAADKFAQILAAAGDGVTNEKERRAISQLLYHLGRIIYIADAYQDFESDLKGGRYNPIAVRFGIAAGEIPVQVRNAVDLTLQNSQGQMMAAFELLPGTYWSGILRNIVFLGIPDMCSRVIEGTYKPVTGRVPGRINKIHIRDGR